MLQVRQHIYEVAAGTGRIPRLAAIAETLGRPLEDIRSAVRTLAAERQLILVPNSDEIWSAPPFWDSATTFRVRTANQSYWSLCIWDALGIVAYLRRDATIETTCGDCGEPLGLSVHDGVVSPDRDRVVHFAIAARHFWSNVVFT